MFAFGCHHVQRLTLLALLLLLCACQSPEPAITPVATAAWETGQPLNAPAGEVLLTVTGRIDSLNSDTALTFDLAMLEALGTYDYTVVDPFEQREIRFTGVLMRDFIAALQVDAAASELRFVALNDYAVTISLSDLTDFPVIMALKSDGAYMQPSYRGPAMLVFPYGEFDYDATTRNADWIWQITAIEVR